MGRAVDYVRWGIRRTRTLSRMWHQPWALTSERLGLSADYVTRQSNGLIVRDIQVELDSIRRWPFLASSYRLAAELCVRAGARFDTTGPDLMIEIGGIKMRVETEEELGILYEIHVGGCYNIMLNRPVAVIDVGMNVGYASLWFAARMDVVSVWSYEPIPLTYQAALDNISLNPSLSAKVVAHNFGLGLPAREVELEFDPRLKGKTSVGGLTGVQFHDQHSSPVRVQLYDVVETFSTFLAANPAIDAVAKIDCEGSEYEIIEALSLSGLLSRFSGLAIEWHVRGFEPLRTRLLGCGFGVVCQTSSFGQLGMLYAIRNP